MLGTADWFQTDEAPGREQGPWLVSPVAASLPGEGSRTGGELGVEVGPPMAVALADS